MNCRFQIPRGYFRANIRTYSSTDRWTFTTINEPMYGEHPVSGNRNFGYKANTDGSYTFYTQGVDRLTSWDVNSAQVIPEFFKSGAGVPFAKPMNYGHHFKMELKTLLLPIQVQHKLEMYKSCGQTGIWSRML